MIRKEIRDIYLQNKFGILNEDELVLMRIDPTTEDFPHFYYICPCGGKDHYASIPQINGEILTCYSTNKQWLVKPINIIGKILEEENLYFELIEKAPSIVNKIVSKRGWSEETAKYLSDTRGIDKELAEEIIKNKI